jgi:hypothetical protein
MSVAIAAMGLATLVSYLLMVRRSRRMATA